MQSSIIKVQNIKCEGCASTIARELEHMPSVVRAAVDVDEGLVRIDHANGADVSEMVQRLGWLGYPELGKENLVTTAKSFVSCMVGRLRK